MSYNYDLNPWDDDYSSSNPQQAQNAAPAGGQQQQPTSNYTGSLPSGDGYTSTVSGFSNPAAHYEPPDSWNGASQYGAGNDYSQQQYSINQQIQQTPTENNNLQETGQDQQEASTGQQQQQQESIFKRFLRAHVPLCGTCMDLSSAICTPVLDTLLKYVNRDLLVSKLFYFFFYSAFGSLFPLMGVYFKQLGMNPAQVGILTGVRPFIEIFSAPFWSGLAERFQKGKALLLFSLISWIIFTYSLAHIRPPASACIAFNDTDYVLYTPYSANDLRNYDIDLEEQQEAGGETKKSGQSNEVFIRRMPSAASESEQESKDKVLAVEENQSVQGSRRRRRRKRDLATERDEFAGRRKEQLDRPDISRYVYSVEGRVVDDGMGVEAESELKIDLENDFDDSPLGRRSAVFKTHSVVNGDEDSSFFGELADKETKLADDGGDDSEHTTGQARAMWRYRRSTNAADQPDYEADESESGLDREKLGHLRKQEQPQTGGKEPEEQDENEQETNGNGGEETDEANGGSGAKGHNRGHQKDQVESMKEQELSAENNRENGERELELQRANKMEMEKNQSHESSANKTKKVYRQRHKTPPTHIVGISPITVQYAVNYNKEKHGQFVTPMFSTIVYKLEDIKNVFFLLLLLISLGEFFSAPAITIADSITLCYLGENTDLYGRQRTFGSFGWAITLLLVGMALDDSKFIADHPCGPHQRERSYTVCFTIFSLLMGCAFITATQFNYVSSQQKKNRNSKTGSQTLVTSTTGDDQIVTTTAENTSTVDDLYASTRPREIFNTAPPVNAPPPNNGSLGQREKFEFLDKWKSAMFAQRTKELPEWVNVFRQFFRNPLHLTYLFITWFLGCGVGLVFTFLFWHLQDVGGTPTLFGICSVINHISEVLAYFFSSHFIKRFGHTKVSTLEGVFFAIRGHA